MMKTSLMLAALAVAATGIAVHAGQSGGLDAGDPAPAFSLPGSDDRMHSLADYSGQVVVLAWFPMAFTAG